MKLEEIAQLTDGWKDIATVAHSFRWKVLSQDRDDFESHLIVKIREVQLLGKALHIGGMVLTARYQVLKYWRQKAKEGSRFTLLDWDPPGADGREEMEAKDAWLDAKAVLESSPEVLAIAEKRVSGNPLTQKERKRLRRYRIKTGHARTLLPFRKERIEEARKGLGLSREKLARCASVPYAVIYYYETGKTRWARSDCLEKLAKALTVPLDYLTEGTQALSYAAYLRARVEQGGDKDRRARAEKRSPEQRREQARKAAQIRWGGGKVCLNTAIK